MRSISAFTAIVLLVSVSLAADDSARAVVERGIAAQGGVVKLSAERALRIKLRGVVRISSTQPAVPITIDDCRQLTRYETMVEFAINGEKFVQSQSIEQGRVCIASGSGLLSPGPGATTEIVARKQAEDLDRLDFLDEPGVRLTRLPDARINGRDAAGVLVKFKRRHDTKLYFDKQTGLLAKREHLICDHKTGKPVVQEVFFSDWRQADGIIRCHKLTVLRDGSKFLDLDVVEFELFRRSLPLLEHETGDYPPRA